MFRRATGGLDARHRGFFAEAGDVRQVWARRSGGSHDRLVYLPPGGVDDAVRDACRRGELTCPLEDCADPRFVARGGELRRHHFAHRVAHLRHASQAVWRQEAAAMLAEWARGYRGAEVEVEVVDPLAVMVVRSARTARTVRLAVTYDRRYSPTPEELRTQQLLLGHTRGLLLPRAEVEGLPGAWSCGAGRLASELVYRYGYAIAINPQERLVGTLVSPAVARRAGALPRRAWVEHALLCLIDGMDDCRLTRHGLETPTLARLASHPDAWLLGTPAISRTTSADPPDVAVRKQFAHDPRREEYLRRAVGLDTDQRLALLREIFLPDQPQTHDD